MASDVMAFFQESFDYIRIEVEEFSCEKECSFYPFFLQCPDDRIGSVGLVCCSKD